MSNKPPEPPLQGLKFDDGKPMMALLPPTALILIGQALTHGAGKYGAHNWRKGIRYSRILSATLRHLVAFIGGEDLDEESKLPHLAHAATNLMFLLEYHHTPPHCRVGDTRVGDDRYKEG